VRKTIRNIIAQYGAIAAVVYLAIFFAVLGGIWAAFHFGWRPESVTANAGTFTAAYLATKVTQPLRLAATVALTPFVSRGYERVVQRLSAARVRS
jgi:hypothetical protein